MEPNQMNQRWQLMRGDDSVFHDPNQPVKEPATPSEWFVRRFPYETERWGCPFLELATTRDGYTVMTPAALNDNFFAAILNDRQLLHSVVYFEPDGQWYFRESRDHLYHPTSEAKLIVLLSWLLLRCAEELGGEKANRVDLYQLFVKFREEEVLKGVVKKGRSILAADESFFSADNLHRRIEGPEQHQQAARQFIATVVKPQAGRMLTVNECFETFNLFCHDRDVEPIERRFFKQMIVEIIKEEFGLGLRSDLKNADGRYLRGWKGLAVEMQSRN